MNKFRTIPLLLCWVNAWNPTEVVAQAGVALKSIGNAGWDYRRDVLLQSMSRH